MTFSSNRINLIALALAATCMTLSGCATTPQVSSKSPYANGEEPMRDPLRAQSLTMEANKILTTDPEQAETLLRQALEADLWHGPAHNNLGTIYLKQSRLYEAASEFEWARKLMPGHPDPRMNLALTFETAGRIDDALETYATALEVYSGHMPTLQAMARCQLRHGRQNDSTPEILEKVALNGQTAKWRDWARNQFASLPSSNR